VIVGYTTLDTLSVSMLTDEVLAPWSSRYRRSDATPSHMSKNLAAALRHIVGCRGSRVCYKDASRESAEAALKRS
jgi:hypothetical protein